VKKPELITLTQITQRSVIQLLGMLVISVTLLSTIVVF